VNIKRIINIIFLPVEKILTTVGALINQLPTKEEIKGLRHSPVFKNTYPQKNKKKFDLRNESAPYWDHRAKGSVNTDTRIFNKPRH
jgi:hypothetical protein